MQDGQQSAIRGRVWLFSLINCPRHSTQGMVGFCARKGLPINKMRFQRRRMANYEWTQNNNHANY